MSAWPIPALFLGAALALPLELSAAPLEPYQMVRSLQLVQDRIANGDQAAMPMQRKLLEIIDARLRTADVSDFKDRKNLRSLFVYAMSGGNPATVRVVLSRLELDPQNRKLSQGIMSYMQGALGAARTDLKSVDPLSLAPEVGAFVALVRGAVLTREEPAQAMKLFDTARLLSPGTLVEEAALRRSLGVAAALGDAPRFTENAWRYVARYLHSPYASQFAEDFVSGIVALHDKLDLKKIDDIVSHMSDEQAKFIYLRLARKGAIEGYKDLLAFASQRAEAFSKQMSDKNDPRALLYSSIASVTSENVHDVRKALDGIDESRLSAGDRELLDAARKVADEVVTRPALEASAKGEVPPGDTTPGKLATAAQTAMEKHKDAAAPAQTSPVAGAGRLAPETAGDSAVGAADEYLTAARDKLESIDKLLEEQNR